MKLFVDDIGVFALNDVFPVGSPHSHELTDIFGGEHGTIAFGTSVAVVAGMGADLFELIE